MTDEFIQARDQALSKVVLDVVCYAGSDCEGTTDGSKEAFLKGADWAYEWCVENLDEDAFKLILKSAKIGKQQVIIDRLKEALNHCSLRSNSNPRETALQALKELKLGEIS